jgi:hypothetical protein
VGLKLNGTHSLLSNTDDVNLLGDNKDTVNKSTVTLISASNEVGLEVNIDKTKVYVGVLSPECRSKSEHYNSKQTV